MSFTLITSPKFLLGQSPIESASAAQKYSWVLHRIIKQESLWKQKTYDRKIVLGDKNTKFFHKRFSTRRRNKILAIQNLSGIFQINNEGIAQVFLDDWKKIVTSIITLDKQEVFKLFQAIGSLPLHLWLKF